MSTKRSVGRITATQEKYHPGVPTQETRRPAAKSKKDRSINLCAFTFADGRQCRTPRRSGHPHLCYFHAQKEAESLAAQQVGEDISRFLPTKLLTACDLGVAMSRLFCAVARGEVKPKVATTLAYLAQTMLQSIPIAQDEYINSFDTDTWRTTVRSSFRHEDPDDADDRTNTDGAADDPAVAPAPQAVPQPPAQPAAVAHPGIHPDTVGRGEASSSAPAPTQVASTPASNAPQPAPIAAHAFTPHERRIRSACNGWPEFIPIGDPDPANPRRGRSELVPTRSGARLFNLSLFVFHCPRPIPHLLDATRTFIARPTALA